MFFNSCGKKLTCKKVFSYKEFSLILEKGIDLLDSSRNHLNKRVILKRLKNGNGFDG